MGCALTGRPPSATSAADRDRKANAPSSDANDGCDVGSRNRDLSPGEGPITLIIRLGFPADFRRRALALADAFGHKTRAVFERLQHREPWGSPRRRPAARPGGGGSLLVARLTPIGHLFQLNAPATITVLA